MNPLFQNIIVWKVITTAFVLGTGYGVMVGLTVAYINAGWVVTGWMWAAGVVAATILFSLFGRAMWESWHHTPANVTIK